MKKYIKIASLIILIALIFAIGGFMIWAANPLGPMPEALEAIQTDEWVQVEMERWLVFDPVGESPTTGLIFYPGGRVDYRSYAPLARLVAIHGYRAVIVPMPLSLAVFAPDSAARVIESFPDIENWAIAGHSLGGAMAASFTDANRDLIDGLILLAAYPTSSNDLSDSSLTAASIYGTLDGVALPEEIDQSRVLLPPATIWLPIEGGNHAQFGWYGPQNGDNPAAISREEQQSQTLQGLLEVLQAIESANPRVFDFQTAFTRDHSFFQLP